MKWFVFGLVSLLFLPTMVVQGDEREIAVAEESLPRLPKKPQKDKSKVLMNKARAIVLVGDKDDVLEGKELEGISGVEIRGVDLPGKEERLKTQLLPYIDHEITTETVDEIKGVITTFYQQNHHPLVLIQVPSQEVTTGVLQFAILESQLGAVQVEGNRWTSSDRLIRYTGLEPGDLINERELTGNVSFMNRNPFRRVDIIYTPGEEDGTTDVILGVKDRRPVRVYAGAENTGIESIGRGRWYSGFNWGNAFGLDHVLSYQFTSAYNMHRFHSHSADYLALLSWEHVLNVFGGYSEVHPKVEKPMRRNSGWSLQGSL
ncbi:MAG: ShlB/FhaC/HecB family hemolysin secretion/activation protein [Simkaniaceae bacterium]|nr:MAG: ShlB/FhaC/HecB family hemolysin secretion/activation protein [Simkaniaceae bacterium]